MPGLVGLITGMPRECAEPQLQRMLESIRHESFYVSGTWMDESLGVYVGWVARQGCFADGMPLRNERGDVTLVFSGEEFPEPGMITALRERGHAVAAEGPSYLVHRYEEEPDFPKGLNGRFHGLVADRARGTVMLFNDRFGLQRLYYHEAKEAFYFAAEAKAILKVRPELRDTDPRGLGEFIVCGCVLENRTLFRGIHVLPPGAAWRFRDGVLEEKADYFEPAEWEEQQPLEPEEYYTQLRDAFVRRLPRYFNGHERIGVSLTGGLDTRIIMAWRKAPPGSLALLHVRQHVSGQPGRTVGAQSCEDLWPVPPGYHYRQGISITVSTLCGAIDLPHGRLRRPQPLSRSLCERASARDSSGENGRDIWQRNASPCCDVQAGRTRARNLSSRKFCRRLRPPGRITMRSAKSIRLRLSLSASRPGTIMVCLVWSRPR